MHATLNQILHQPSFNQWRLREKGGLPDLDNKVPQSWTDHIKSMFESIGDFISWLFRSRVHPNAGLSGPSGESLSAVLKLCAWIVVAGIAIFLCIVIVRTLASSTPQPTLATVLSREQVREAMESGDALAMASTQWMDEARRLAEEQDFRAVYRAMYLALLSGLHAAGKIEHHRNRTNWVYVAHYRGPARERERFSQLTELFDRVWYGRKVVEGANIATLQSDVNLLIRADVSSSGVS